VVPIQKDPEVSLFECRTCRASSASRLPTVAALEDFYRSYYACDPGSKGEDRVTFDLPVRLARHIVSACIAALPRNRVEILDYGGGDGAVSLLAAELLLESGLSRVGITVVDLQESPATPRDDRIRLVHAKSLDELEAEHFDLVIASAIVEHLTDPRGVTIRLLESMSPSGCFYARTPYILPFVKVCKALRIRWNFMYPGHLHDLGPRFWRWFFHSPPVAGSFELTASRPSIVAASFTRQPLRAAASHLFKAPWKILGNRYGLVGGWEIFSRRT
jgi:hypothetical protein